MFEILAMLGGGIFRLLPEVLKLFNAKRDADHEFRMTELQLKIDKARADQALDIVAAQSAAAQGLAEWQGLMEAVKAQGMKTGVGWVDAISSTVRPFLTYYFCVGLYGSAKVIQIIVAFNQGAPLADFIPILVTEFDRTVIGSMLSYWFIDRTLRKSK